MWYQINSENLAKNTDVYTYEAGGKKDTRKKCKECHTTPARKGTKFDGMCAKCYNASKGLKKEKDMKKLCKICKENDIFYLASQQFSSLQL